MIRESASVRLIWSLGPGPATGGAGGLPPGFLPCALALASRAAILVSYSACSRARRSLARASILARASASFFSRASRHSNSSGIDSVAFRFIAANDHPDHDTIATFRRRFLKEITELFVKVLMLGRQMGVLQLGTVALDGTKIHANASRHSALSYEHAGKLEAQLEAEVGTLLAKAEAAD